MGPTANGDRPLLDGESGKMMLSGSLMSASSATNGFNHEWCCAVMRVRPEERKRGGGRGILVLPKTDKASAEPMPQTLFGATRSIC